MEALYVQSRTLEAKDLKWIRQLIDAHPGWNRTKLSRHIARRWEWRNQAGQLKDMACRSMLLKLEQKGLICLPAPQRPSNNGCAFRPVVPPMAEALARSSGTPMACPDWRDRSGSEESAEATIS